MFLKVTTAVMFEQSSMKTAERVSCCDTEPSTRFLATFAYLSVFDTVPPQLNVLLFFGIRSGVPDSILSWGVRSRPCALQNSGTSPRFSGGSPACPCCTSTGLGATATIVCRCCTNEKLFPAAASTQYAVEPRPKVLPCGSRWPAATFLRC
jgi:hypothetical protein